MSREQTAARKRGDRCSTTAAWPSNSVVKRLFGSWNEAIMAAGLEPAKAGRKRKAAA